MTCELQGCSLPEFKKNNIVGVDVGLGSAGRVGKWWREKHANYRLTLEVPNKIAADDILILFIFRRK